MLALKRELYRRCALQRLNIQRDFANNTIRNPEIHNLTILQPLNATAPKARNTVGFAVRGRCGNPAALTCNFLVPDSDRLYLRFSLLKPLQITVLF